MKTTTLLKTGLLALALAAATTHSARAAISAQYHNRDLLIGFYDPNDSNQYVLDLGPLSSFNFNTSFTLANTTTHLANDLSLSNAFGTNWYTDPTLYFGVVAADTATSGSTAHDVYATNPNGADNPWPTSVNQGTAVQDVATIGLSITQKTQAAGQTSTGLLYSKTATGGWDLEVNPNDNTQGAALDTYTGLAGDGGISTSPSSTSLGGTNGLEFEYLKQGAGTAAKSLGYWSVNSAGDVSFTTAAAVPEPSTFAAIGMGAVVLGLARRRRLA